MATDVILPKVDMDMDEGTIAVWHVTEGAAVTQGEPLFDMETGKAAMEVEAPATGILRHVSAKPGDRRPVGTVIARIYAEGEPDQSPPDAVEAAANVTVSASPAPSPSGTQAPAAPLAHRPRATPAARRAARDAGVDLATVTGSGPHGRIQRADVDAARAAGDAEPPAPPAVAEGPSGQAIRQMLAGRPFEVVPLDSMRRTIASRLSAARRSIPHFNLQRGARVDRLLAFRAELNGDLADRGTKITLTDLIIRAAALALQKVPDANAVWADDCILRLAASDIAVAVSIRGGLLTPVLRDAETKSLSQLSHEMADLAARARARRLMPADYQGGAFAISNLGMFGVESFDAIISPPQSAILAVGAVGERLAFDATRQAVTQSVLTLTLSVDHRVIDGALGAELLAAICSYLESPLTMVA